MLDFISPKKKNKNRKNNSLSEGICKNEKLGQSHSPRQSIQVLVLDIVLEKQSLSSSANMMDTNCKHTRYG